MSRFVRQLGKRFKRRFNTSQEYMEKNEVGSDSPNIMVTADADRLARKPFTIHADNDGNVDANHEWGFLIFAPASSAALINESSGEPPSKIRLDQLSLHVDGQNGAGLASIPAFSIGITATIVDLSTGSSSTENVFRAELPWTDLADGAFFDLNWQLQNPIEFDISDITEVNIGEQFSPSNPANFVLAGQYQTALQVATDAVGFNQLTVVNSVVNCQFSALY